MAAGSLLAVAWRYAAVVGLGLVAVAAAVGGFYAAWSAALGVGLGLLNSLYLRWVTARRAFMLPAALKLGVMLLLLWACLRWLQAQPLWLVVGLGSWLIGLLLAARRSLKPPTQGAVS